MTCNELIKRHLDHLDEFVDMIKEENNLGTGKWFAFGIITTLSEEIKDGLQLEIITEEDSRILVQKLIEVDQKLRKYIREV